MRLRTDVDSISQWVTCLRNLEAKKSKYAPRYYWPFHRKAKLAYKEALLNHNRAQAAKLPYIHHTITMRGNK